MTVHLVEVRNGGGQRVVLRVESPRGEAAIVEAIAVMRSRWASFGIAPHNVTAVVLESHGSPHRTILLPDALEDEPCPTT